MHEAERSRDGRTSPAVSTVVRTPAPPHGLTEQEVAAQRARFGPNSVPEAASPGLVRRTSTQLRDPTIVLLLGAALLSWLLGDVRDVAIILLVVLVNTAVGVGQELRAERALDALQSLAQPVAKVWRDDALVALSAVEIVPGDVVVVEAGDIVPADATLIEAAGLECNESALTGESEPVPKHARTTGAGTTVSIGATRSASESDAPPAHACLGAGTVVTRGRGTALVTATGPDSAVGRIASLLGRQPVRPTPLQQRLRELGRVLAVAAVGLSLLVMGLGVLRGRSLTEMVLTAVSLAVAAVPESLPAVVTLALALGARRMSRRSAIVRRLGAVETLGSVTVFLTDKTGTLTQNKMSVDQAWAGGKTFALREGRYVPETSFTVEAGEAAREGCADDLSGRALHRLLRDAVLCNDAELHEPDTDHAEGWLTGEGMEVALLAAARTAGVSIKELRAGYPRVAEVPFDSTSKRMTTLHAIDGGKTHLVVCKGAPEVLMDLPELVGRVPDGLREASTRWAEQGLRVLAVAEGTTATTDPVAAARGLDIVGLLALSDPARPEARNVIDKIHQAGVQVAMVTGDHPATAESVAARVGIVGRAVAGADGENGAAWAAKLTGDIPAVFARTRPEQKVEIVAALQAEGHVVAMTGDGVNDAPALEGADIGIAMGADGTEVAKQAADLVLTDDRLETIVVAIGEGRRVYANIRTFLQYALAGGMAEVVVMLLGPFVGLAVPLLPGQILWINLLTHGLPGVAFGAEPGDPKAMCRPPRSPNESVLGDGLWLHVVLAGTLVATSALTAGIFTTGPLRVQQSAVFLSLGLAQLGVALALRRASGRAHTFGFLDLAVASSLVLQVAAIYAGPVADLLGTEQPSGRDTIMIVLLAMVPGLFVLATRLQVFPVQSRSIKP